MTIGIIEDDTLLHQALKTALQNAGYQTVSAYTKQEALTTITGSESLLLIDIGLPDGNGLACYKKIREKAEIPAIFLTARDEETDMLTAFDTGADDYVVKPFSMKVLLKRIEAVIGRNNREKQLACGEIILFPDKKQVYKNEKEINFPYSQRISVTGISDVQSGKCTDERKYPGICMGTGWPVCSG